MGSPAVKKWIAGGDLGGLEEFIDINSKAQTGLSAMKSQISSKFRLKALTLFFPLVLPRGGKLVTLGVGEHATLPRRHRWQCVDPHLRISTGVGEFLPRSFHGETTFVQTGLELCA